MKYRIEDCHEIARNKGGFCLETVYINDKTKMKWFCGTHEWMATFNNISRNTWCPTCYKNRITIETCHELAKSKEGECLEAVYITTLEPMRWKCKKGHEFVARFGSIKNGNSWCRECLKHDISLCHEIAKERGGECLENVYVNNRVLMKWKCEKVIFGNPILIVLKITNHGVFNAKNSLSKIVNK